MDQLRVIDEEHELRRRNAGLRDVVTCQHAAAERRRRMHAKDVAHDLVQLGRRHTLAPLVERRRHGRPYLVDVLLGQRRCVEDRRIWRKREFFAQRFVSVFAIDGADVDKIPLVDQDDERFAFLNSEAGDPAVL